MRFKDIKFEDQKFAKGKQALLEFGVYDLSIVQNEVSYGGKMGLYEIGVFKGDEMVELPGITQDGDTVKGFLTESNVEAIIQKMFLITATNPVQAQVRNMEVAE